MRAVSILSGNPVARMAPPPIDQKGHDVTVNSCWVLRILQEMLCHTQDKRQKMDLDEALQERRSGP